METVTRVIGAAAAAMLCYAPARADAPRGFIGASGVSNDWSTTSAIEVRASSQRVVGGSERLALYTIDGAGVDPAGENVHIVTTNFNSATPNMWLAVSAIDGSGLDAAGDVHDNSQTNMWLSQQVQVDPGNQRGGTVEASH